MDLQTERKSLLSLTLEEVMEIISGVRLRRRTAGQTRRRKAAVKKNTKTVKTAASKLSLEQLQEIMEMAKGGSGT